MNESKPLDLDAIRVRADEYSKNYLVVTVGLKQILKFDIPVLCDEVESLRERVRVLEGNWAALKDWLNRDKENGSGHKVSRALFLMAEIEDAMIKERTKG